MDEKPTSCLSETRVASLKSEVSTSVFAHRRGWGGLLRTVSKVLLNLRGVVVLHVWEHLSAKLLHRPLDLTLEIHDLGLQLRPLQHRERAAGHGTRYQARSRKAKV